MKKLGYSFLFLISCSGMAHAQSESVQTPDFDESTLLDEVVVKGKRAWKEGEKYIFVPSKSEKNLSTDAMSLVNNMHTGILYLDNGNLKSRLGAGNVSIFINGVPADKIDLSTFWPQNAVRVEYMYASEDPKFQGKTNIVNFIMKEYVVGGLTKLTGVQTIPNYGDYSASSKLVYKKMTYNVLLKGGYSNNHLTGSDRLETFENVWYEGEKYDLITRRNHTLWSSYKNHNMYGGFNARYKNGNVTITHNLGLSWQRDPGSSSVSSLEYSPEIAPGGLSETASKSKNLTPSIGGNYFFNLSKKWSFRLGWNASHTHNDNCNSYSETSLSPIINDAKEDVNYLGGEVTVQYRMNKKNSFTAQIRYGSNWFDTTYRGYTHSEQNQRSGQGVMVAQWYFQPSNKLSIQVSGSVRYNEWSLNHAYDWWEWMPGLTGSIGYTFNSHNSLYLSGGVRPQNAPNSSRNDLIIRQDELSWLQGNLMIDSPVETYAFLTYSWLQSDIFRLNATINVDTKSNSTMVKYSVGGVDYDGVIGRYENAGRENNIYGHVTPSVALFNGALWINLETYYYHKNYTLSSHKSLNFFQFNPGVNWTFGNNNLWLVYNTYNKSYANGGSQVLKSPDKWFLMYTFGIKNFNLMVSVHDLFKSRKHTTIEDYNGPYTLRADRWGVGRNVSLHVTYTFDYGKKVTPGIDISAEDTGSTSVLGSGK